LNSSLNLKRTATVNEMVTLFITQPLKWNHTDLQKNMEIQKFEIQGSHSSEESVV
jgi:hypothetical protein